MKKILNFGVVLLAGTFLFVGCAGVKKEEAPAPGPANDLVKKEAPVQNAMKLLDRIQYGKTYVGSVSEIPQEEIDKGLSEDVLKDAVVGKPEGLRKSLDDLLSPHRKSAEVAFSKEGERVSSLAARDKEKKSHVICADVKTTVVEKDEAAIKKQEEDRTGVEATKTQLTADKAGKEAQLQSILAKKDEERTAEDKVSLETLTKQIEQTDNTLGEIEVTLAEINKRETTKTTVESDTLCYTFNKAELEKKIDSETSFSQANVLETRYDAEEKTVSEAPVALSVDNIAKDGSKVSGRVERDADKVNKTIAFFSLALKQDEEKQGDENKEKEKTND